VGLLAQIQAFMLTFILGILAGLIFHYYQSTLRNIRIGRYLLYLLDLIMWIIMLIIIGIALLVINQGEIRAYVFIALISGGLVYYKLLARHLQQPINVLGRATAFLAKAIFSVLTKPFIVTRGWLRAQYQKRKVPPIDDSAE
jgi:spore cortex biosynthesis protein YabQ